MKLHTHTLAALLASTIAAAAVAAPSTATSTLPPGVKDMSPDQIDYNLQAIDAAAKEQQELARQKEAARAAAQAAAQEAAAKEKAAAEKRAAAAARAKAQQQAAAAKEKAAYLLESIGEQLGEVISVIETQENSFVPGYSQRLVSNISADASGSDSMENIRKIKLRYEMTARFGIK